MKIWKMMASSPLAVGVIHEEMPQITQTNIYYELGVAQAMGKETIIVKSPRSKVPSDLIRNEYIEFNGEFEEKFSEFLAASSTKRSTMKLSRTKLTGIPY